VFIKVHFASHIFQTMMNKFFNGKHASLFCQCVIDAKNAYKMRSVFPLEQLIKCIEIFNESSRMTDFKMHSWLGIINLFTLAIYGCNLRCDITSSG
jgi:hypothetical protein